MFARSLTRLGEFASRYGKRTFEVDCVGSVKRNGTFDRAVESLKDAGRDGRVGVQVLKQTATLGENPNLAPVLDPSRQKMNARIRIKSPLVSIVVKNWKNLQKNIAQKTMPEFMTKPDRLFFIDNIRWLMIIFVIMTHAAVTYSSLGMWYYVEPARLDIVSLAIFGIYQSFTQAYSMGLLFLIAGYFVPGSFDRKGFGKFLRDRAIRLGIPTLIYMLFIHPVIIYYLLAVQWKVPRPPVSEYFLEYIQSLNVLSGTGPMWFALALLIFSATYAVSRQFRHVTENSQEERELPGHLAVAALALLISAFAFSIRLIQPIGTSIMNMQLGYFTQYIILFIIGTIAYRKNWLVRIPYSFGMIWFKSALIGGSVFWLAIMVVGGGVSGDFVKFEGGYYWQSAAYALWESFFCVGICLGFIVFFREHFNVEGKFTKFMSDNYFSVYVFHPPILILVTLALRDFSWHPLAKFITAVAFSVPLCFMASHLVLRRIPLIKEVL